MSEEEATEEEEYVDLSEPPRTWKQAVLVEKELRKQKLKEQSSSEEKARFSNTQSSDPLGFSSKVRAFRNRQSRWDVTQQDKSDNVDIAQENFNPALFLSTLHHSMGYESIEEAKKKFNYIKEKIR
jgi:hypothetical protein